MTEHYFEHTLATIHYYKFGEGPRKVFCFHGYGMHGRQFTVLQRTLSDRYTFYGFDLFFHKETRLHDESMDAIRKGLSKFDFAELIHSFCAQEDIRHFSVIAYSMGTHYATALAEQMPKQLDELILLAPSCLKPGTMLSFFSSSKIGNRLFEKLMVSDSGLLRLLKTIKLLGVINQRSYEILYNEIATPELRFSFFACATYMRLLEVDEDKLVKVLNEENIRSYFIFGAKDRDYPAAISDRIFRKLKKSQRIILDEDHELVNRRLADTLYNLLA